MTPSCTAQDCWESRTWRSVPSSEAGSCIPMQQHLLNLTAIFCSRTLSLFLATFAFLAAGFAPNPSSFYLSLLSPLATVRNKTGEKQKNWLDFFLLPKGTTFWSRGKQLSHLWQFWTTGCLCLCFTIICIMSLYVNLGRGYQQLQCYKLVQLESR